MAKPNITELSLYTDMFLIRTFEEEICPYIEDGTIMTPCHLYIGQEAIAVGVSSNLNPDESRRRGITKSLSSIDAFSPTIEALWCSAHVNPQ